MNPYAGQTSASGIHRRVGLSDIRGGARPAVLDRPDIATLLLKRAGIAVACACLFAFAGPAGAGSLIGGDDSGLVTPSRIETVGAAWRRVASVLAPPIPASRAPAASASTTA